MCLDVREKRKETKSFICFGFKENGKENNFFYYFYTLKYMI